MTIFLHSPMMVFCASEFTHAVCIQNSDFVTLNSFALCPSIRNCILRSRVPRGNRHGVSKPSAMSISPSTSEKQHTRDIATSWRLERVPFCVLSSSKRAGITFACKRNFHVLGIVWVIAVHYPPIPIEKYQKENNKKKTKKLADSPNLPSIVRRAL